MSTNRYIVYSNQFVMDHYRVMRTIQVCACGAKHLGSYASEVFVVYHKLGEEALRSMPLREVLRRYSTFMHLPTDQCRKFLPELETKILMVESQEANMSVCVACVDQWLKDIPNRDPSPEMLPLEFSEVPVVQQKEIGKPKQSTKAKGGKKKAAPQKPLTMAALLKMGSM